MIQSNLEALRVNYTGLYNILIRYKGEGVFQLEKINENYNIIFNNKYIHSRYNPAIEAARWVDGLSIKDEEDCIFIIGLGLGYYLDHLIKKYPNKKIIILEPSKEVFQHFLSVQDATAYIENTNIVFLVGKELSTIRMLFDYYLNTNKIKKMFYTELPIYRKIYAEYIKDIYGELKKVLQTIQCNISTDMCYSRRWLYNTLINLKSVSSFNNITALHNLFEGIPVVIVSAGPSLEKNMHLLKELYNNALIIAVGTAASILDSHGVMPHIIMGVDGSPSESTIFKKLKSHSPLFIYAHMVHFESLEVYKGNKMWMHLQGDDRFEGLLQAIDTRYPTILAGNSIAHIALAFADGLRPSAIMMIGQDLAYTNKKLYATGSAHEIEEKIPENYIIEKDIYGNEIYTKAPFLTFKHWFENYVDLILQDTKILNCTEGGLNIEGIPNSSFHEAINLYCNKTYGINELILRALGKSETISNDLVEGKLKEYKEQVEEAFKLSKERVEAIIRMDEKEMCESDKFNQNIDEILNITTKIEEMEFYNILIKNTGKIYYEAITREITNMVDNAVDLLDKRKIMVNGLLKQYNFAHENILVAKGAMEGKEVNGLF